MYLCYSCTHRGRSTHELTIILTHDSHGLKKYYSAKQLRCKYLLMDIY